MPFSDLEIAISKSEISKKRKSKLTEREFKDIIEKVSTIRSKTFKD